MLYNKDWEKTHIKADPFSLESLIAWLEKQPASTEYDWDDCAVCLVGKYITAITGDENPSGVTIYAKMFSSLEEYSDVASVRPWTFGAALGRARKALAER
jgi:hypothetical protein